MEEAGLPIAYIQQSATRDGFILKAATNPPNTLNQDLSKTSSPQFSSVTATNFLGNATSATTANSTPYAKNFTGDWKYTVNTPNGQTLEPTLKLKQDGDKLTGTLVMNTRETPITDAKIDGNKVTFTVERERNGNKVTSKYDAKLEGGDLKGKITSNFGGNDRTYDFDAKKQ